MYNIFQPHALPIKRLCALRVVPDVSLLKFSRDLLEALQLGVVVKDTP
jgi:hypothetical protein